MVNYPSTADSLTNPTASDKTNSATVPHATQHANLNDIVELLEAKLGYSSSTSGAGIVSPSTSAGDVFYVSDTAGRTRYGPRAMVSLAEAIATSTGLSSVTFSNIPQTYRHLEVGVTARGDSASTGLVTVGLQFNGDTGANYNLQTFFVSNTIVTGAEALDSTIGRAARIPGGGTPAGFFCSASLDIQDYTSTALHKTAQVQQSGQSSTATGQTQYLGAVTVWASTAPVTQIDIVSPSEPFAVGSRFTLHGKPV